MEEKNLCILTRKNVSFTAERMRQFAPHVKEEHLSVLLAYLNEDSNEAWHVVGPHSLALCLTLRETIRQKYQTVQPYTLIHASDSPEAVEREYGVLFDPGELTPI